MARKLIDAEKKLASILRVLNGERTVDEERRRLGVATQTMARFVAAYAKKYPEADKRVKQATEALPPPPAEKLKPEHQELAQKIADTAEDMAVQALKPEEKPGLIDVEKLKAAMLADGGIKDAQRPADPAAPPRVLSPVQLSTEKEDLDVVEGVANQLNGLACRGILMLYQLLAGVRVSPADRAEIQKHYVLTDAERSMLRPASRHIAGKLREWIGTDERISLAVGGSTIGQGLMDRWNLISESMDRALAKAIAELPPEERKKYEEARAAAEAGAKA